MSKQTINVGSAANDGTGTPTRTAFQYVNANFTELYNAVGGSNGTIPSAIPVANGGTGATTAAAARTNLGLGDAATKNVGAVSGNLMEVGNSGLGYLAAGLTDISTSINNGFFSCANIPYVNDTANGLGAYSVFMSMSRRPFSSTLGISHAFQMGCKVDTVSNNPKFRIVTNQEGSAPGVVSSSATPWYTFFSTKNAAADSNGFIKAASPIVQLFSEKIELNDEAKQQDIVFEKLSVGNYLVKGSNGFAQDGWYVEMPKDANGNVLVAVVYKQLENKDISVKTYKKKFDIEIASIVADLTQPVDIPEGRWIDLRLQELPQEVIDEP